MKFPPPPPRIGAAPVFSGGAGTRDVITNATLIGTAVPGVVMFTLVGENVSVYSGKLPGQMKFTVPVKILSGTSCKHERASVAGIDGNFLSSPLAKVIW